MTTLLSNFASIRMPENVCVYVYALSDVGERKYAKNQRDSSTTLGNFLQGLVCKCCANLFCRPLVS